MAGGVRDQELDAIDALSGEAVHLADDGAPDLAVGDLQGGGSAVIHFDLVGLAVQAVALGGFQLRHLIPALVGLGQRDNAGPVRGIGPDNLAVELADFKLHAADPLPGFLVLLDDGETSDGRIFKGDGLRVVGIHLDCLAPGVGVQDIAGQGLQLRDDDSPGDAGNDDLALGVGGIEAVGGNPAAVQVHIGAICVGDLEFHSGQGLLRQSVDLVDNKPSGLPVPEGHALDLAGLDGNALRGPVQEIPRLGPGLPGGDDGSGLQVGDGDAPVLIRGVIAVVGSDNGPGLIRHQKLHAGEGGIVGAVNEFLDHKRCRGVVLDRQVVPSAGAPAGIFGAAPSGSHAVAGAVLDRDGPGGAVQNIALWHLGLHHHNGAAGNEARYKGSPVLPGDIAAQDIAVSILHGELGARDRLSADRIQLRQREGTEGFIEEGQGLRVHGVHRDGLRLRRLVDHIAGGGLRLLGDNGPYHAGNPDFSLVIRGVEAVAGEVAVVVVHKAAACISQLELRPGDKCAGNLVLLLDHQCPSPFVPERELLDAARLDLDVLGCTVQHKALHGLDFPGDDYGAGFNAGQDDLAGFVGVVEAVVRPDSGPGSVYHPEGHAGKRLVLGALDKLPNNQGRGGGIVEIDGLRVVGIHHNGLGPGVGVDAVAGDRLQLRYYHCPGNAGEDDLSVAVRVVDAIRGNLPVFVVNHLPVGVLDLELHALQGGVVCETQFIDDKVSKGLVEHLQGIGLVVLDLHGVGRIVKEVSGLCLDLPHNVAARL